jgi:hypothetical protein
VGLASAWACREVPVGWSRPGVESTEGNLSVPSVEASSWSKMNFVGTVLQRPRSA